LSVSDDAGLSPADFAPWPRSSPFADHAGPLLFRRDERQLTFAVLVEERHTNARGTAHGGMLATLADLSLGYAAAFSTDPPTPLQTANLNIDLLAPAQLGDFVIATPRVLRLGSRLAHADVTLLVGSRAVARASCVSVVDRGRAGS
jgi:acyl-coenzyme A thioesterase 13